jgi:hypothetical protein
MVLLADCALNAEQAMLHDARDVVPGVQELVDAHRTGVPTVEELRALVFDVPDRRYQLLLGLRRSRNWSAIRPRAFAAAFDGLTRGWRAIVCDASADLEGEKEGGSADVEERNTMARTIAARADAIFVVGQPSVKGIHSLIRVLGTLLDHGVPGERLVAVINRAPRSGRHQAEIAAVIPALLAGRAGSDSLPSPVFLPERRVDDALRDGVRLHPSLTAPLAHAFEAIVRRAEPRAPASGYQRVAPGSLGHWSPDITAEPA